jgi:hypothetical protein
MPKYTGYGDHNELLNELEDLKLSANLRANDLLRDSDFRIRSQATADAYDYCQQRLMIYGCVKFVSPVRQD